MNKQEKEKIIIERANLITEYINQILLDSNKVTAEIQINKAKIENNYMTTLEIYVIEKGFERHFNTGLSKTMCDSLNEKILDNLIINYKDFETVHLSKYKEEENMWKVEITNDKGTIIRINFVNRGKRFDSLIEEYNYKLKN